MSIFVSHLGSWLVVFGILLFLGYAMKVIASEKQTYLDDSDWFDLKDLKLPIPKWWTKTLSNENNCQFERTDTRYDWWARFSYVQINDSKELTKILEEHLELEQIEIDPEVQIQTEANYLFKNQELAKHFTEILRIEGTATEKVNDRIYYDLYLFRKNGETSYYQLISRSSVLNGGIEGPYFEEAISRSEFKVK